jgi:hypothetical protein
MIQAEREACAFAGGLSCIGAGPDARMGPCRQVAVARSGQCYDASWTEWAIAGVWCKPKPVPGPLRGAGVGLERTSEAEA